MDELMIGGWLININTGRYMKHFLLVQIFIVRNFAVLQMSDGQVILSLY